MPIKSPTISLSIVLTSFHEESTLEPAVRAILAQKVSDSRELIIVSPDNFASEIALRLNSKSFPIICIKDQGHGKPGALNLGLKKARGDIVVLTDGDVTLDSQSLSPLIKPFSDSLIGAVSGRPISVNPKNTMLGYWSHFLTDGAAHPLRLKRSQKGQFLECSGYLFAFRRSLITQLPPDALAEDALISSFIWKQGYKIAYSPNATVKVKFPTTLKDWVSQKLRTTSAYYQPYLKDTPIMRSFFKEAFQGIGKALRFAESPKELSWTLALFALRIYVWFRAKYEIDINKKPPNELWHRIESTK